MVAVAGRESRCPVEGREGSNPSPGANALSRGLSQEIVQELSDYVRWGLLRYSVQTIMRDRRVLYKLKKAGLLEAEQKVVVDWLLNYPATASTRHVMFTSYLRWLRYGGLRPTAETLAAYKDLHRLRERKLARIPTSEVAAAVVGSMRPSQARNFYTLVMETGLRFGEAYNIRWSQIDFKGSRLVIEHSEKRSEGSILPLSDNAIQVLEDQRRRVPSHGPNDPVFRLGKRSLLRSLERARKRMSHLPGSELVNAKNLRHLFATRLYAQTKDLVYVQRMLRHRSILTTQRYVHMVVSKRVYDVKVVPAHDKNTIAMLLAEGYDFISLVKDVIYLRRLKE